jgi:hypothetical protein
MTSLALASDVDVGAVLLRVAGAKLSRSTRVDQRITGGTLERTIEGASTLTLELDDHDRALIRSGVFTRQLDLDFDGVGWRLVQVSKQGDALELTFEDRAVAYLRKITTPRKAARSKMTRAEFALSIVREVKDGGGIPFVCPDLHVRQKVAIETSADKKTPAQREATSSPGVAAGAKLTVKGAPASTEQRANAERVMDVAASLGAGTRATLALIQAVIVESTIRNLNYGDRDSLGILQVRSSTARGMRIDNRDVEQCCNAFLTRGFWGKGGAVAIAAKNPSMTTGQVAQNTQGSGVPGAYDQWRAEAERWLAAYGGDLGAGTYSTTGVVKQLPYQFQRGGTDGAVEDSWTCLQRLAGEVNWRCFVVDGALNFVAESTLIKAKPRATLSEDTLGVDVIDFDVDNGKATSDATVTARAGRHSFPPGSVVVLEDCGPADGRWLVKAITRGVFDASSSITLKRETDPLPEPAAPTTTVSSGGVGADGLTYDVGTSSGNELIDRAYAAAKAIDAHRYPYVWGGGHARCGVADGGVPGGHGGGIGLTGFDCSGGTCAVLGAAGMGFSPGGGTTGSIGLESWGEAGEGRLMTVWANFEHVWIEFKVHGPEHFGTGHWGKSNDGSGFCPQMHFKNTFTPRHWPGT